MNGLLIFLIIQLVVGILLDIIWFIPKVQNEVASYHLSSGNMGVSYSVGLLMVLLFPLLWLALFIIFSVQWLIRSIKG